MLSAEPAAGALLGLAETLRGLGVEEVDVRRVDGEGQLAGVGRELAGGGLHDEFGARDLAVEELSGAEFLDEVHIHGERAGACATCLHVLGAHEAREVSTKPACMAIGPSRISVTAIDCPPTVTRPEPSTLPGRMFMGGEPMKVATNRVSGRR